jgi:Tol biopolymer transport system component
MFGEVSPDGRRALDYKEGQLVVVNLASGRANTLGSELSDGSWSPDGRWIAAWGRDRITLFDADDPARRRDLGRYSGGAARWSPDSKYLLLSKQELRCTLSLYFGTLEIVEVDTGNRTIVKSSRCSVGGWFGWIDRGSLE